MGAQGLLRDSKARRYYGALPQPLRDRYEFRGAYCWRSNHHVWIKVRDTVDGSTKVIRMNRDTLQLERLGFANEV